jgi:hypothetical protein
VRRPRRRIAVPGKGPANTGKRSAHEHQWITGKRYVYLDGLEIKWRKLSTTGASSDGSGERRLRVRAIPARRWPGLDRIELGSKGRR